MAVVVWVQGHLFPEGVDIRVELEMRFVGLSLGAELIGCFQGGLGDLVDFEDAGLIVEDVLEEPENSKGNTV